MLYLSRLQVVSLRSARSIQPPHTGCITEVPLRRTQINVTAAFSILGRREYSDLTFASSDGAVNPLYLSHLPSAPKDCMCRSVFSPPSNYHRSDEIIRQLRPFTFLVPESQTPAERPPRGIESPPDRRLPNVSCRQARNIDVRWAPPRSLLSARSNSNVCGFPSSVPFPDRRELDQSSF